MSSYCERFWHSENEGKRFDLESCKKRAGEESQSQLGKSGMTFNFEGEENKTHCTYKMTDLVYVLSQVEVRSRQTE